MLLLMDVCPSLNTYDNVAMATKVKGYMLLGATLQTAEKEKRTREEKRKNEKQRQTEHMKDRPKPGKINH